MAKSRGTPEELLAAWRAGDLAARDELVALLYDDLVPIASALLKRERRPVSIETGDLLGEAMARLFGSADLNIVDTSHFLALSAHVMSHVLFDLARSKVRQKRRGTSVTLTTSRQDHGADRVDLLALERSLIRLKVIDPERAEIVEMRYFGMTIEQIALVKGVSPATVKRMWEAARLWLREAMENDI